LEEEEIPEEEIPIQEEGCPKGTNQGRVGGCYVLYGTVERTFYFDDEGFELIYFDFDGSYPEEWRDENHCVKLYHISDGSNCISQEYDPSKNDACIRINQITSAPPFNRTSLDSNTAITTIKNSCLGDKFIVYDGLKNCEN